MNAVADTYAVKYGPLSGLANLIEADWKNVSPYARPYLDALHQMQSIHDSYGLDDGTEIVARFLANATGWRGPEARQLKAELRRRFDKAIGH